MSGSVTTALQTVDRHLFCFDDDGNQLPQTSSPGIIARLLRLLDVRHGHRVLEIGTGSGYSTALLAELTGPSRLVVSVDVDPELAERTRRLVGHDRYQHVYLVTGDGRQGRHVHAPYDRVIAWCSVAEVPVAWFEQSAPGAILVVPMRADNQPWVSRYRRSQSGPLIEDKRVDGGFIPLTPAPFRPRESTSS